VIFTPYFLSYDEEEGALTAVTTDDTLCPAGRVLRETGRKLYPGANLGITQYYIGVYDDHTLLNGFIDPNDGNFAEFNSNKPTYVENNMDDGRSVGSASVEDLGDPVYTSGNITAIAVGSTGELNENYIQLTDISGNNAAYFGFDNDYTPYMGCQTDDGTNQPSKAYVWTSPNEATLELLGTGGYVVGTASYGGLYVGGTSNTLNLQHTCGIVTLTNGTASLTVPDLPNPVVFLTRVTSLPTTGNAPGANTNGILTWNVTSGSLTITSVDFNGNTVNDNGSVSWIFMTNNMPPFPPFTPAP
jgi:hypothetical protein